MSYKVYFVDIDDTVLDFHKSSLASFEQTMKTLDLQEYWLVLHETFKSVSHKLWKDYELGLVDRLKVRYERFTQTFEHHNIERDSVHAGKLYLDNLCSNVYFIEGALEILKEIKEKGATLGFITNGVSYVQERRIKGSPMEELVDFMVVSEDSDAPKPHVSMFEKAYKLSGSPKKKDIIMLGDSLSSDIQGSMNFEIDSCWYNPNNLDIKSYKPTYEINNILDFRKHI